MCSPGLGDGPRYCHVPRKNASVKCFDAALGKVYLPCLRFIVVWNGPVSYFGIHSLFLSVACFLRFCMVNLAMRGRTPLVVAVGSVKHEGPYQQHQHVSEWRTLPGVVHRGLHVVLPSVRGNHWLKTPEAPLPFCSHCGKPYCPYFLHASVCLMFRLFLAWHCDLLLLFFDTLDLGTFARSSARCFFVSLMVLSNRDLLYEFWQFARNFFSRNVDLWGPFFFFAMLFFTDCATCFLFHSSRLLNRDSPGSVEKCVPLDPQDVTLFPCGHCTVLHPKKSPHELNENDSHVLPEYDTQCCDTSYTRAWIWSQFS